MKFRAIFLWRNGLFTVLAALLFSVVDASATVVVSVNGNVATATIDLPSAASPQYSATVTITFDSVVNLSPDSLNLTASLIDLNNPPRLPAKVSFDPNFPVIIQVEPPHPLFSNSFETNQASNGDLDFLNTYLFEIHTANLDCTSPTSTYRLYKAPHGSDTFADVTSNLYSGSVRARGRGGAFSRFVVVNDNRPQNMNGLPVIALSKVTNLTARLAVASIGNPGLVGNLTTSLGNITADLVAQNPNGALANLDTFDADVQGSAGTDIANEWNADRTLSNDAGELLSISRTLRFSVDMLNSDAVCTPPID